MHRLRHLLAIVVLLLLSAPAGGKGDKWAREQLERANAHYSLGRFELAAEEYLALHQRHPEQPAILFNIAQSYRLAGKLPEAVDYYQRYLDASPHARNRHDAEEQIRQLGAAIAETERAAAPPPSPAPQAAAVAQVAQPSPPPAPVSAAAPAPKRERPVYKKWWLWTVVAVVVAAAVVVPTAVVLSQKRTFHSDAPDFGPGASSSGLSVRW